MTDYITSHHTYDNGRKVVTYILDPDMITQVVITSEQEQPHNRYFWCTGLVYLLLSRPSSYNHLPMHKEKEVKGKWFNSSSVPTKNFLGKPIEIPREHEERVNKAISLLSRN